MQQASLTRHDVGQLKAGSYWKIDLVKQLVSPSG